jgi:hypothetical protein
MNHDNESDPLVSAEYRAAATERTPTALDAVVLKNAEAAAKDTAFRRFTTFWFRPLAFVATLGLSLALLLELNQTPEFQPVTSPESEFGRSEVRTTVADPAPAIMGITSEAPSISDSPANRAAPTQSKNSDIDANRPQEPEPATASADFAEMIEASSRQMREQESVTEVTTQPLKQSRPAAKESVGGALALTGSAIVMEGFARACTKEQISKPATWWQCISDLQQDGRHDEAKAELDLFNEANPDFEAPVILPSQ